MANIFTVPTSGFISFDNNNFGQTSVQPLSTAPRLAYDGLAGLTIACTTSSSNLTRFSVEGSTGRLFTVTDILTGTLFTVSDSAGLPVLEVSDNDTVVMGEFDTNTLVVSGTRVGIGSVPFGTNVLSVSGNLTVAGNTTLSGLHLGYITETKVTPTISTNVLTLDLASAAFFSVNLNQSITTFTLTNVPSSPRVYSFTLQFVADGTARTVTWPTGTRWSGNTPPTLTSTLNKVDTFAFLTHDEGTNWFAYTSNQNQ
jgi:hypothetical protein